MGFLDFLTGKSDEKEENLSLKSAGVSSLKLAFNFSPLRLTALKDTSVTLITKVKNNGDDKQLVSIDFRLPDKMMIGFDKTCLQKNAEKKVGEISPGETKEVALHIYGCNQTKSGVCPIIVTTYSHYIDYEKVINSTKKQLSLRIS